MDRPPPPAAVVVRRARDAAEERSAGEVTAAAYDEFRPRFDPDDWAPYALTLPDTAPRVAQGELLVAVDQDDDVVGTATLYLRPQPTSGHWRDGDAVIRFLAVRPDRQGKGIGAALLEDCIGRARGAGLRRVALQTTPHMVLATRMYESRGFVRDKSGDLVVGTFVLLGYALDLDAQEQAR